MPFASTISHQSKTLPGVTFVVHRIGFGRRTDIELATVAVRQRLRELTADYPPPTDAEKPLMEQLAIAQKKALAVPADQFGAVMSADVVPLQKELAAVTPADIRRRRELLNLEYAAVERMQSAEWIKGGLVSITGGDVDGMTAEQLLGDGPPDLKAAALLAQEIFAALIEDGKLVGAGSKTQPSLITSGEAAGGESQNTTAPNVEAQQAAGT